MKSKNLFGLVVTTAFLITVSSTAFAANNCLYDVVGDTISSPSLDFQPDGQVTFGMENWWEDDIYACYYTHANPNPMYMEHFGACDRSGNGIVEFEEVIEMYQWTLDHPNGSTPYAYECPEPTCEDVGHIDFAQGSGPYAPVVGYGMLNGECRTIIGNEIPMGVALFHTEEECWMQCGCASSAECGSEEYCDFSLAAECGMMGKGECKTINHIMFCSWAPTDVPVCGCNGQDYNNQCFADMESIPISREGVCPQPTCNDVSAIDFEAGIGELQDLGWAVEHDGVCRRIMGNYVPPHIALYPDLLTCSVICMML